MYENFTERAVKTVKFAQDEARLLDHNYIGTEHLLLGLLRMGQGAGPGALTSFGITLDAAVSQVEEIIGRGDGSPPHMPFTPRAKKCLELAVREAVQMQSREVHAYHVLLGILREGDGVACQIIVKLGSSVESVRARTLELMAAAKAQRTAPDGEPLKTITMREGDFVTMFDLMANLDAIDIEVYGSLPGDLGQALTKARSSRRKDVAGEDEGDFFFRNIPLFDI